MRITNWKYKGNRNIIISNDNIGSATFPSLKALFLRMSISGRHFQEKGFDVI